MPIKSQKQRRLMYAAAAKPGGVDGVPQSVAKEFVASDKPGKLPETARRKKSRREILYGKG